MPGNGGHWEFYNDRSHAEKYFEDKHPTIAQFRKKIYEREVSLNLQPASLQTIEILPHH
jgi:hypothetical protein